MKSPDTLLLIAAGPRQHTPALQRAFDLAQRQQAPVHILLLAYDPLVERSATLVHPEVKRLAQQQLLGEQRDWLDGLVQRWQADGLQATGEVLWAPRPHEAILARTLELTPALVIKDVGHEPLVRRLTFTALDWRLLRYCPAPLLLVHEHSAHLPRRILAAVDTTPAEPAAGPLNERVLLETGRHAGLTGAEVHLAHVFPYLPFEALPYRTLEQVYAMARSADLDAFAGFAATHQVGTERRHWLEGNPAQRITELVQSLEIDLLVLGSAYRSGLDRLFLGSTSEAVLDRVACDVLLVKPRSFDRELALHLDTHAIARRVAQAAGGPPGGKVAVLRPNAG
jgi:universal stress protein E